MERKILYLRVDPAVWQRLKDVTEHSGSTLNAVAERALLRGLGLAGSSVDAIIEKLSGEGP